MSNHAGVRVATGTDTTNKVNSRNGQSGQWHLINNEDPIRIWHVDDGTKVLDLGPLRGAARALAFSADDRFLVSAQTDLTAHQTV